MSTEICLECDGSGSIDVEAAGPSGRWTMRLHPTDFGYRNFSYGQVWEPRRRRTRSEDCPACDGAGVISHRD